MNLLVRTNRIWTSEGEFFQAIPLTSESELERTVNGVGERSTTFQRYQIHAIGSDASVQRIYNEYLFWQTYWWDVSQI